MGSAGPEANRWCRWCPPAHHQGRVVGPSERDDIDIEYLFLQVSVDRPEVTDRQNCGNMLAAVGPFALERGLISATDGRASVRILMKNTGGCGGHIPRRSRNARLCGRDRDRRVPGGAAEIVIEFEDIAGSSTGALLPTGRFVDEVTGVEATLIDNGMPVVVLQASDVGGKWR